ncbi:F-type H+-transporting ATPase subunit gamma [Seinonella peptonophila]|uniref:ATP synthase gamma chain n=1 Tax=Seinonella peptonophila TaxID=112248 RepID=A0A1M4XU73_9BACL|nr:ATP synthase F1 subunit gamma [Seinonella peptonophila]SHE97031.1 F-type H+-transporting ATPase subunit gamma [Seinonella peptonophila]
MAQNMREIKRRIRSFDKNRQITKAMKMVAASKLRRAQQQAEAARPYAEKLRDVIVHLANGTSNVNHPMLASRPVRKAGYLVITSDRGLAGGYNSNLLRKLTQTLDQRHDNNDEYVIFVIGRKGLEYLQRRKYPVIDYVTGLGDSPTFAGIKEIARQAVQFYAEERFDELYLVYNKFVSAVNQHPEEKRLLPLAAEELAQSQEGTALSTMIEFEPSEEEVLQVILPRYAETLIYSALLEAKASEFAMRMAAMTNATDNATEMIDNLTLQYNRARQAAITQEIAEIVGGANAL